MMRILVRKAQSAFPETQEITPTAQTRADYGCAAVLASNNTIGNHVDGPKTKLEHGSQLLQ